MKPRILVSSVLAILTMSPVFAGTRALLPPQTGDMVPTVLLARTPTPSFGMAAAPASHVHLERQPVSISWALPHDSSLQTTPQPFVRSSREYWIDAAASSLQQGIELPLTAPGAIIRLSPSDPLAGKLQPATVHLQLGRHALTAGQASSQIADARSLHEAGMDVPAASLVMKLNPALGSGMATLRAPTASGRYVVHVFEPQSAYTLTAAGNRDDVLLGRDVHVRVVLHDANAEMPLQAVGGYLRAPDGHITTLTYQRQTDGSFAVDVQPKDIPATPGLWEVHSFSSGHDAAGNTVRRDTTTVFSAAVPDARLSGIAETARASDQGIDITLGVTVQGSSRYAVSAVLYGRSADGLMVPAAYAQSAAWLPKGNGQLVLHYNAASLTGIGAPYEVHDLRLQDQPAIGLIERRAVALRFDTL